MKSAAQKNRVSTIYCGDSVSKNCAMGNTRDNVFPKAVERPINKTSQPVLSSADSKHSFLFSSGTINQVPIAPVSSAPAGFTRNLTKTGALLSLKIIPVMIKAAVVISGKKT